MSRRRPLVATDRAALMLQLVPYLIGKGEVSILEAADEFDVTPDQMDLDAEPGTPDAVLEEGQTVTMALPMRGTVQVRAGLQNVGTKSGTTAVADERNSGFDLSQATLSLTIAVDRAAHNAVAIAQAAAAAPGPHPPLQPAPRLVGQVLEVQRAHGSLEAHVQLGDVALRERHDPHPGENRRLVQARHMLLVAAEPVEALR